MRHRWRSTEELLASAGERYPKSGAQRAVPKEPSSCKTTATITAITSQNFYALSTKKTYVCIRAAKEACNSCKP